MMTHLQRRAPGAPDAVEGRADDEGAAGGADPGGLQEKYRSLCEKYRQLCAKFEATVAAHREAAQLAALTWRDPALAIELGRSAPAPAGEAAARGAAAAVEHAAKAVRDVEQALEAVDAHAAAVQATPVLTTEARARVEALRRAVRDAVVRMASARDVAAGAVEPAASLADAIGAALEIALPHLERDAGRRGAGISLAVDVAADLPRALIAPRELHHALASVILHAIDGAVPPGLIEIAARASGEWLVASVADRGEGVAPVLLDEIADPLSPGASESLGLAAVARALRGCGGVVSAANRPGGGSIFTVTLRAAPRRDGCQGG